MASPQNFALQKIQEAITKIELNEYAFEQFSKLLCNVRNGSWKEDLQVRKYFGIKNFSDMAQDIKDILKLPPKEYNKLLFFHKHGQENDHKTLEVEYKMNDLDVRYVCFALYKYPGGIETDLIFCYYTLVTKPAIHREVEVKTKTGGFLWLWRHQEAILKETVDTGEFQKLLTSNYRDDYFRYKVVDAFAADGLVDRMRLRGGIKHLSPASDSDIGIYENPPADSSQQALFLMQQAIYSIECNEASSERFRQKLSTMNIETWSENAEVQKSFNIADIDGYLDDLRGIVDLPERDFLEMKCACKYARRGEVNKMELCYAKGELMTCYLFYAIHKHEESGKADMVYAHFRLKSKAATKVSVTKNVGWGGIFRSDPKQTKTFTWGKDLKEFDKLKTDKDRENYFRYKVLLGFVADGLVEKGKLKLIT